MKQETNQPVWINKVHIYLTMKPTTQLYVAPWLLLVTLTCSLWGVTLSAPILGSNAQITRQCIVSAQTLLWNISEAIGQEQLFRGINCTSGMELSPGTQTVSVCMPKQSTCSGFKNTEFDQEKCLKNIEMDLRCYNERMLAFDPKLRVPTVLKNLGDVKKNCFALFPEDGSSQQDTEGCKSAPGITKQNTFDERVQLCKVLKGLHVRMITINRIISYIHAGEYM